MRLKDKVALVTGASSGIGLAVARRFADEGARVALVARGADRLEQAAAEINQVHGPERALAFVCDVSDLGQLAKLVSSVVARLGGLDILVNNAGVNHRGPILERTAEELVAVLTTNLTAPVFLSRLCAEKMQHGGAIVNVASLAGMVPVIHEAAYSASKAGLRAFTRVIGEELAERGVRACTVCPGPVDTNFFGDVNQVPDLVFSQPMSTAEEVAEAVMECIVSGTPEIAMPKMSGRLATLGYVFPRLGRLVRPMLEKRGAKNKKRYMERQK
jgi:NAD(P)-dependent dehydrogenase (short-subunit alcohol dehydrogenase family)